MGITLEQLKKAFGDEREAFLNENIKDHIVTIISLLREKIPYEKCRNIISAAGHDIIYLCDCDINTVLESLNEDDLAILADCNCSYDSDYERLYTFV